MEQPSGQRMEEDIQMLGIEEQQNLSNPTSQGNDSDSQNQENYNFEISVVEEANRQVDVDYIVGAVSMDTQRNDVKGQISEIFNNNSIEGDDEMTDEEMHLCFDYFYQQAKKEENAKESEGNPQNNPTTISNENQNNQPQPNVIEGSQLADASTKGRDNNACEGNAGNC